jgi:hypothetical protein
MGFQVQIAPIGFEYKRVIAGFKFHPPNLIYLLYSKIESREYEEKKKFQLDQILANLSEEFTKNLEEYFKTIIHIEVKTYECSFVIYKKLIKNLCDAIKEILDRETTERKVDAIWINIGTATKLFVNAAQYIASFMPDRIHLFYVQAHNYTINLLLDKECPREEIEAIYRAEGITYSKGALEADYSVEDLPVIPSQMTSKTANRILKLLFAHSSKNYDSEWVSFANLLKELEKGSEKKPQSEIKSLKMKYHHHIQPLIDRKLIESDPHGREKRYRLTEQGTIFAIIVSTLPV